MSLHPRRLFPSPQPGPELRVRHDAQHQRVNPERNVVKPHRRLRGERVADGVLLEDHGRVKEQDAAEGIAGESEHVQ